MDPSFPTPTTSTVSMCSVERLASINTSPNTSAVKVYIMRGLIESLTEVSALTGLKWKDHAVGGVDGAGGTLRLFHNRDVCVEPL